MEPMAYAELAAKHVAVNRLRGKIRERLDAPYAVLAYDDHLGRFETDLVKRLRRTGHPLNLVSRNKRYTFWWHEKGNRLIVKVSWRGGRQSRRKRLMQPIIEDLAARLRGRGACRLCGAWFERNGTRKKFCSPAHAARWRKLTWRERKKRAAWEQGRDARRAASACLIERNEELRRLSAKTHRAALGRRRAKAEKTERIVNERERAFKEAGGQN